MAALDFPAAPTLYQTYTANGVIFMWDGAAWINVTTFIRKIGDAGLSGDLQWGVGSFNLLGTDTSGGSMRFGFTQGLGASFFAACKTGPAVGQFICVASNATVTYNLIGTPSGSLTWQQTGGLSNTIWHSGNDGSGSGLDADLLDGKDSSTSATANTVGVRDANGYFFSVYFNQSSGAENPTIGNVFVENNAGDGYHRKISLANFASQLPVVTTSTPTPTAGSGAFTTVSATVTLERIPGEHFYRVTVTVTITNNGTAGSWIMVPLGITASKECVLAGRAAAITGAMVQGIVPATNTAVQILAYNNTYPGQTGERITLTGDVYV